MELPHALSSLRERTREPQFLKNAEELLRSAERALDSISGETLNTDPRAYEWREFGQLDRPRANTSPWASEINPPITDNAEKLIRIELGRCMMSADVANNLPVGSILVLDDLVVDPVTIFADDRPIACGQLVVTEGCYGVRITALLDTAPVSTRIR